MFNNSNLVAFIFTFLPCLLFSFGIYKALPITSRINWVTASFYFILGCLSTSAVLIWRYIFPNWGDVGCGFTNYDYINEFIHWIIVVALVEEGFKLVAFKAGEFYREKKKKARLVTYIFYAMSVSCGFAVIENLSYASMYGQSVLLQRSFSSVIIHMSCGVLLGYFIALGLMYKRKHLFTLLGLIAAVIFHGTYDFYISQDNHFGIYGLLGYALIGIIGSFFAYRHLSKKRTNL